MTRGERTTYAALRVGYSSVFHYFAVASAPPESGWACGHISGEKKPTFSDPGCLLVKTTF